VLALGLGQGGGGGRQRGRLQHDEYLLDHSGVEAASA
jgi:hypothetical protein